MTTIPSAEEKQPPAATELATPEDPAGELQKEIQKLVVEQFRKIGFLSDGGRLLSVLLEYELLTADQISDLLLKGCGNPRLRPGPVGRLTVRAPSRLEQELAWFCEPSRYPDFDPAEVTRRQKYWLDTPGTNAEKQNAMLMEDPMMQAIALDALIRSGVNRILTDRKFGSEERALLRLLLLLRYGLLRPVEAEAVVRQIEQRDSK